MSGPVLPDDHDEKWVYQAHTKAKHEILQYYLTTWTRIVSNERYPIRIFDCFAGRGDYTGSDGTAPISLKNIEAEASYPGSPLVILDVLSGHKELFRNAELFFIDSESKNLEDLRSNIDSVEGNFGNISVNYEHGNFENIIEDLITESNARNGFAFFFMDPFGLKALDYNVVKDITGTARFDSLITLMTKELIRWKGSDKHDETFSTLFGTNDWKEDLTQTRPDNLYSREAEYYCNRLMENGPYHTLAYMVTRGDTRGLMYHLVFTSNDDKGVEAMKESMLRCGTEYTLAYAPNRSEVDAGQLTLQSGGVLSEEEAARSYILTRFAGKAYEFGDLARTFSAEQPYVEILRKDLRDMVKELHNQGEINIPDRKPPDGGHPDHYVVEFPE